MSLVLYGHPASQPSRAVYWICLIKELRFEIQSPEMGGFADSEMARLNPKRQMPTIADGDFSLYEMPAILIYLCEKHGWDDLYPKDLEARALVNQYLHFHHSSTRLATMKLMAPHVTVAFREALESGDTMDVLLREAIQAAFREPDVLGAGRDVVAKVAGMIESGYLRDGPFLVGSGPTIADIACYEELAQLRWANLFDFERFPRIQGWLAAMPKLPFHEEAHAYNRALGDIRTEPLTMQRFLEAGAVGQATLREVCT